MNDIQEAAFVAQEMLPHGHYQGRLNGKIARHLARKLCMDEEDSSTSSSLTMVVPSTLILDLIIEVEDEDGNDNVENSALAILARALQRQRRLRQVQFRRPLSLDQLQAWTSAPWTVGQLDVLEVTTTLDQSHDGEEVGLQRLWSDNIDDDDDDNGVAQVEEEVFAKLTRMVTRELILTLGPSSSCCTLRGILKELQQQRQPFHPQCISLGLPYENATQFNRLAQQLQEYAGNGRWPNWTSLSVRNYRGHRHAFTPSAWLGLSGILTSLPQLQQLALYNLVTTDNDATDGRQGGSLKTQHRTSLSRALSSSSLQELTILDWTHLQHEQRRSDRSSAAGGVGAFVETILDSLVADGGSGQGIQVLTIKTPLSSSSRFTTVNGNLLGDSSNYSSAPPTNEDISLMALHAAMVARLPHMHGLRALSMRWGDLGCSSHTATSTILMAPSALSSSASSLQLWNALQSNTSLLYVDAGGQRALGARLAPMLERNRLLDDTQRFLMHANQRGEGQVLQQALDFALRKKIICKEKSKSLCSNYASQCQQWNRDCAVTASAAYVLMRDILPHKIRDVIIQQQEPHLQSQKWATAGKLCVMEDSDEDIFMTDCF